MAKWNGTFVIGALLALGVPMAGAAVAQITSAQVVIPRGKTGTTIAATIVGDQTRDYLVNARAGQTLKVTLKGASIVYFNVLAPGSNDEAMFIGSTEGNAFAGTLSVSGTYRIRVYQMRASARRGERGPFKLTVEVTGAGAATAPSSAARDPIRGKGGLEDKCKAAVAKQGTRVIGTNRIEESQAAVEIFINVAGAKAPWRCLAQRNGTISSVEYTGSEGAM